MSDWGCWLLHVLAAEWAGVGFYKPQWFQLQVLLRLLIVAVGMCNLLVWVLGIKWSWVWSCIAWKLTGQYMGSKITVVLILGSCDHPFGLGFWDSCCSTGLSWCLRALLWPIRCVGWGCLAGGTTLSDWIRMWPRRLRCAPAAGLLWSSKGLRLVGDGNLVSWFGAWRGAAAQGMPGCFAACLIAVVCASILAVIMGGS
ncbi:hypothetical protein R6Q59_016771 [Mikania micrantha]